MGKVSCNNWSVEECLNNVNDLGREFSWSICDKALSVVIEKANGVVEVTWVRERVENQKRGETNWSNSKESWRVVVLESTGWVNCWEVELIELNLIKSRGIEWIIKWLVLWCFSCLKTLNNDWNSDNSFRKDMVSVHSLTICWFIGNVKGWVTKSYFEERYNHILVQVVKETNTIVGGLDVIYWYISDWGWEVWGKICSDLTTSEIKEVLCDTISTHTHIGIEVNLLSSVDNKVSHVLGGENSLESCWVNLRNSWLDINSLVRSLSEHNNAVSIGKVVIELSISYKHESGYIT